MDTPHLHIFFLNSLCQPATRTAHLLHFFFLNSLCYELFLQRNRIAACYSRIISGIIQNIECDKHATRAKFVAGAPVRERWPREWPGPIDTCTSRVVNLPSPLQSAPVLPFPALLSSSPSVPSRRPVLTFTAERHASPVEAPHPSGRRRRSLPPGGWGPPPPPLRAPRSGLRGSPRVPPFSHFRFLSSSPDSPSSFSIRVARADQPSRAAIGPGGCFVQSPMAWSWDEWRFRASSISWS
jgi:hypothetical protein